MSSTILINKTDAKIKASLEKACDVFSDTNNATKTFTASRFVTTDSSNTMNATIAFSSSSPQMNGVAAAGTADSVSRGDHIHPRDTSKADVDNAIFTGTMTVGSVTPDPHYPDAKFVAINGDSGHTYSGKLGVTGEALSDADQTSCGVGGNAKTFGANKARGVVGVGKVDATGDTGIAVGVEGRSTDTHAGANNVAFQADAQNGAVNYSFEGLNGSIINKDSIISGDGTNSSVLDSVTGLKLNGTATNWIDLAPFQLYPGIGPTAAAISIYNAGNMEAYEFVGSAALRKIHSNFQMPHGYKEGSDITPHIHLYIPNDGTGGNIKFSCEYTWANGDTGAATGTITTTTITQTVTIGANAGIYNNYRLSFPAIVGTDKTISSVLMCRIFRDGADGADTFGSSVWLKSSDVHVEIDTIGSKTISAK